VLVAHPERRAAVPVDGARGLRREIASGACAQVNAQSITGEHGPGARTAALRLVREGLATVVGSDAHGPTRPPLLTHVRHTLVQEGVDSPTARGLTVAGPLRLLARGIAVPAERLLIA
jgi:protein-tyrosine phosphatase